MAVAPWAGPVTFISPTLSAVSASNLTFGMWMKTFWSVLVSTVVTACIGSAIGTSYNTPILLLCLMFVSLVWVNRNSYFEQVSRVIGSLCVVLGALWPYLSAGQYVGSSILSMLLSIILVPFLITGGTLLVPFPALALFQARSKAVVLLNKIRKCSSLILAGFALPDDSGYFGSRVERIGAQAKEVLAELTVMVAYAEYEVAVFPHLAGEFESLKSFVALSKQCVTELQGLKNMLSMLLHNFTTRAFAEKLHLPIEELIRELENVFCLLQQRFSKPLYLMGGMGGKSASSRRKSFDIEETLVGAGLSADIVYDAGAPPTPRSNRPVASSDLSDKFHLISSRLFQRRDDVINCYGALRRQFIWGDTNAKMRRNGRSSDKMDSCLDEVVDKEEEDEEDMLENAIDQEIQRLSFRNFGPRGAFLHRLSVLVDLLGGSNSLQVVSAAPPPVLNGTASSWTIFNFFKRQLNHLETYFSSLLADCSWLLALISLPAIDDSSKSDELVGALKKFVQPCKIAVAICLTSLLVVVPWSQDATNVASFQTGLWSAAVVALIRQDNTSSSWLTGVQRFEGTVLGAIFSFFVFRLIGDSLVVIILAIVIWVGICGFFRTSPTRGYSSVVAGFTPMVLLLGQSTPSIERTYDRIEKSLIGIGIYLIIDNLVLPVKIHEGVRAATLSCISAARSFTHQSIVGISYLMKEIDRQRLRSQSQTSSEMLTDDDFLHSLAAIKEARCSLLTFQQSETTASALLKLAVFEPSIWSRPFPLTEYNSLLLDLQNLSVRGDGLLLAIEGFFSAMESIREQPDQVLRHLMTLSYMARHLCEMQETIDKSMKHVYEAVRLLYETGAASGTGFSQVLSLGRTLEQLLTKVDEHFRRQYEAVDPAEDMINLSLTPLLAWLNVFESTCDLVRAIAALGETIGGIRDAES